MAGKVWTLEQLLAKTAKEGACRVWKGGYSTGGSPYVHHQEKRVGTRALVLQLSGKEVPPGWIVGSRPSCEKGCICHPVARSPSAHAKYSAAMKVETPAMVAKKRIAARTRAKLTPDAAAQIRVSDGLLREVSAQYGVSMQTVSRIRRGSMWAPAGLFYGL
jgi:hypothetical protein